MSIAAATTLSAEESVALERALNAAADGDFTIVPDGEDPVSRAARRLIDRLRADALARIDTAVTISISGNNAAVDAAWSLKATQDLNAAVQETAVAIEELSASVVQIDDNAEDVAARLKETRATLTRGSATATDAGAGLEAVSHATGAAVARVKALESEAGKIGGFVAGIDRIAQQTNLLAINASVEAARAGAAGRSFGIVADEVRQLAAQTAALTKDINVLMSALSLETNAVAEAIGSSAAAVEKSRESMTRLGADLTALEGVVDEAERRMTDTKGALAEQRDASVQIVTSVGRIDRSSADSLARVHAMTAKIDETAAIVGRELTALAELEVEGKTLRLAKSDHVVWKKRLADMFSGKITLSPHELSDHRSCRLGKWYGGPLAARFRHDPAFAALERPHARVHEAGLAAAKAFSTGSLEQALAHYAEVEAASIEVLALLDRLIARDQGRLAA